MKTTIVFLLVTGILWAFLIALMFLTISGVAGPPVSLTKVVSYWGGLLLGPTALIVGSILSLYSPSKLGAIFVGIGCVIINGLVFYAVIPEFQRKPLELEPTPPYVFYWLAIILTLLMDIAAYRVLRKVLASSGYLE